MKIHPRACGICGRAVVRPTSAEIEQAFQRLSVSENPFPVQAWVNGYLYEKSYQIMLAKKIRCIAHVDDQFDPRHEIYRG